MDETEVSKLEQTANELIMKNQLEDLCNASGIREDVREDVAMIANLELIIKDGKLEDKSGKSAKDWLANKTRERKHWTKRTLGSGAMGDQR